MQLNLTHLRIAGMISGIILASIWFMAFDDRPVVQIDFSMYPEFEGFEVFVDNRSVGILEPTGQVQRVGFQVKEGSHEIEVRSPDFNSVATTVELENSGDKARLLLELASHLDEGDRYVDSIVLLQ